MKRAAIILFSFMFLESLSCAYARDCSVSKKFRLNNAQLTGVLQDPAGAELSGVTVEILSGTTTFRRLTTDNSGKYDFGEVPAGECRVRVQHGAHDLCAPKVKCGREGCILEPRLSVNPKNVVVVY